MWTFALRARGSADVRLYFGNDPTRICFRFFDVVPHGQAQSMFPFCRGLRFYGWPLEGSFFGASARLGAPSLPLWAALFLAGPLGCFVLFPFFFLVGVYLGIVRVSVVMPHWLKPYFGEECSQRL